MEQGVPLPWWDFSPADLALPGSVVQPEKPVDEALVAAFLQAGARVETAECFVSANSLHVAGVLDALSRDELVFPTAEGRSNCRSTRGPVARGGHAPLSCRSRLFGLPLADRHSALGVACSLRHRLPRRALVNFLCRIVLGKGVANLKAGRHHAEPHGHEGIPCPCGGRALGPRGGVGSGETETSTSPTPGTAATPCAACASCLARRAWLDSVSARLLAMACSKLLWGRSLPQDEELALERCLTALSEVLSVPSEETPWSNVCWEKEPFYPGSARTSPSSSSFNRSVAGRVLRDRTTSRSGAFTVEVDPPGALESEAAGSPGRGSPGPARGASALLARVSRQRLGSTHSPDHYHGNRVGVSGNEDPAPADKRARDSEGVDKLAGLSPPVKKTAKASLPSSAPVREPGLTLPLAEPPRAGSASTGSKGGVSDDGTVVAEVAATLSTEATNIGVGAAVAGARVEEAPSPEAGNEKEEKEEKEENGCLSSAMRQALSSVAEKVTAAGARGATSVDVQGASAAVICLLQAALLPSARSTRTSLAPPRNQQQEPLQAVCAGLGLDTPASKGRFGCGDDLVMAVCNSFVTPALSLRNCLAFVNAVLVPRARSLSAPASRLLVTAVSGIGNARPGAVIDGLILPLICEGDPAGVGSAQCELCTRLIKQTLPKHTLEAVLVGLCSSKVDQNAHTSGWQQGAGSGGGSGGSTNSPGQASCVWTELTMPVITAALNLKPALSDTAIVVLVRRVEMASEKPQLQKSLKFTTLVHGLVTRYGPQLKPFLPVLRAAIARCSTFMVKAVLAALKRLDK